MAISPGCACKGGGGVAHLDCKIKQARQYTARAPAPPARPQSTRDEDDSDFDSDDGDIPGVDTDLPCSDGVAGPGTGGGTAGYHRGVAPMLWRPLCRTARRPLVCLLRPHPHATAAATITPRNRSRAFYVPATRRSCRGCLQVPINSVFGTFLLRASHACCASQRRPLTRALAWQGGRPARPATRATPGICGWDLRQA